MTSRGGRAGLAFRFVRLWRVRPAASPVVILAAQYLRYNTEDPLMECRRNDVVDSQIPGKGMPPRGHHRSSTRVETVLREMSSAY